MFWLFKTEWVAMMEEMTQKKPVALITGATGGLGQVLAKHLAASGWSLVVVGRAHSRLSEVFGDAHLQVEADCSVDAGARQMADALRHHQVVPAAFAHCVGNIRLGALHRLSQADIDSVLRANLMSAILSLQAYLAVLREARQGGGRRAGARRGGQLRRRGPPDQRGGAGDHGYTGGRACDRQRAGPGRRGPAVPHSGHRYAG